MVAYVETRHGPLAYTTVGRGRPFVLLHGNTYSAATQVRLAQRFTDDYTVYCPDLLGHGHSARPTGLFSLRYFALQGEALADLLETLFPFAAVPVFGMSAGGITALNAICLAPERIAALILDGVFMEVSPATVAAHRRSTAAMSRTWHRYMREQHGDDWWPLLNQGIEATVGLLEHAGTLVAPCLEQITVPTLIYQGGRDPFVPDAQAYAIAQAIVGARLHYVAEAEHLVAWRDPAAFREQVRAFLQDHGL